MEIEVNIYCRFCAEPKPPEKLFRFECNSEKYDEISKKLTFLNASYIDITYPDLLPQTVCFVCYDSLNKAYNFLFNAKEAQVVLWEMVTKQSSVEIKPAVENKNKFDDFPVIELFPDDVTSKKGNDTGAECSVKYEPQEVLDHTALVDPKVESDDSLQDNLNDVESDADLDVQDILDAALNNGSDSNVSIYATEDLGELTRKDTVTSWTDFPWVCLHCEVQFESLNLLRLHGKEVHKKCHVFACECKNINKRKDFPAFIRHVILRHHSDLGNFCYYCNKYLGNKLLEEHVNDHFVKSQRPCPLCGEILANKAALDEHVEKYKNLKSRRKRGEPITTEELTCDICKKVYKTPNSLRDHRKLHTTQRKKDYTCDRCGKSFYNKGTLKSHISVHDKNKPHVCKICNRSFLFANMLRRHVNMHSGVKPYACEQCGKRFRLSYQLKTHKIIHTDEMPFSCRVCNKRFRFKQILINHERQHTGLRPYHCEYCGMEFTNWSNFNKHMKRRHNMDQSKKKITPQGIFPRNPETGQLINLVDDKMEEWKSEIMIPCKRGKKKVEKKESYEPVLDVQST